MDPFITTSDLGSSYSSHADASFAISAACDAVRSLTGQTINQVNDDVIVMDGTGTEYLILPQLPVTDIDAVIEDDETLVQEEDWDILDNGVLVRLPTVYENGWSTATIRKRWNVGRQNVEVTYSHGWNIDETPDDLKMVARNIAIRFLSNTGGVSFESLGQYSVRYEDSDLPGVERAILDKYRVRRPAVGSFAVS